MKIEIDLNANQHALLMEVAAHDRSHRSLASITRGLLVDALTREAARFCSGARQRAVACLVAAGNPPRRKSALTGTEPLDPEQDDVERLRQKARDRQGGKPLWDDPQPSQRRDR